MDMLHNTTLQRKLVLPILTRENYLKWFRLAKLHFQSEDFDYVITTTITEYALIAPFKQLSTGASTSQSTSGSAQPPAPVSSPRGALNVDKEKEWRKSDAKARFIITTCVGEFDQEDIADLTTAKQQWDLLWKKYNVQRASTQESYLDQLVNYKMSDDLTIEQAWTQLNRLRKRLVEAHPEMIASFSEERMFQRLLKALPRTFDVVRDSMDALMTMPAGEKLKILLDKEDRLKKDETALIAKQPYSTKRDYSRRRQSSGSEGSPSRNERRCHICRSRKHLVANCEYLQDAQKLVFKDRAMKYLKDRKSYKPKSKDGKDKKKHRAYAAGDDEEYETVTSSSNSDTDADEAIEEVANISKEQASKIPSSEWVADSGASSHMTDQHQFFSGPLYPIKRRTIKVGGGNLYTDYIGDAKMTMSNGDCLILSKVLYVPLLGVNLLSGRQMCKNGLFGSFDLKHLYLRDHTGREKIRASSKGGVYIVDKISKRVPATIRKRAVQVEYGQHAPRFHKPRPAKSSEQVKHTALNANEPDDDLDCESSLSRDEKSRYELWHRRFAHLGPDKIRSLHRVTTLAEAVKVPSLRDVCEVCALTKLRNKTSKVLAKRKEGILEMVSVDICGQLPKTIRGNEYFLEIIDSYSRKTWTIPLKKKDDAIPALKAWKADVELSTGCQLKAVRSDNGGELKKILDAWGSTYGIHPEYTIVYQSSQNGVAERAIQTTENSIRAMLKDANLPIEFWDEAAEADAYIRNRTASGPSVDGIQVSPEEAFSGERPTIDHIRVWGTKCYSYVNPKSLPANTRHDKLMDRGRLGVMMGYSNHTTKQYRIYAPDLGYTIRSSVVKFDETIKGGTIDLKLRISSKVNPMPNAPLTQGTPNVLPDRNPKGRPRKLPSQDVDPDYVDITAAPKLTTVNPQAVDTTPRVTRSSAQARVVNHVTPWHLPSSAGEMRNDDANLSDDINRKDLLEEDNSDFTGPGLRKASTNEPPTFIEPDEFNEHPPSTEPLVFSHVQVPKRKREDDDDSDNESRRKIQSMIALIMDELNPSQADDSAFAAITEGNIKHSIPIPLTYREAVDDPVYGYEWSEAIKREIIALQGNNTFVEEVPPPGANLVSSKWVFTVKYTVDGNIERFKARLVARGFSQEYGIDYTETFAPTVRMDTLRLVLSVVAKYDLECHQIDVNNAFTESTLKEQIYLSPPQGIRTSPGTALRIVRSLYGLKQSARDWHQKCTGVLIGLGFNQSKADPCLYVHPETGMIILVYVDDLVLAAKERSTIDSFKTEFAKTFKIKDLGEIQKILGIRVIRDRKARTITLDQSQYLNGVLNDNSITTAKHKASTTPMNGYESLRPANDTDERTNTKAYQKTIGSLMYAMVHTRPDIAFALGKLSQYMSDPAQHHAHALKALLRYVRATVNRAIKFGAGGDVAIYSDADWAGDKSDRKSTTGSVCMHYGGAISWASKKQTSVATSSTESEYMALSVSAKQSQWISQVLHDMGYARCLGDNPSKVNIMGDNQGSIALTKNAHLHDRSKHIDICYHYTRDLAQRNRILVKYVPTADMIADGLTKPLAKFGFERFVKMLGMTDL
jgi:hypothetical protein